jgi:hypothetical protein
MPNRALHHHIPLAASVTWCAFTHPMLRVFLKSWVTISALVIGIGTMSAQAKPSGLGSGELQSCLLVTPPDLWTTLKLTRDQMERMSYVQEACTEECDVSGVKKAEHPISNANGGTVMDEVRNILNEDQYAAWVSYCAGKPGGGQAPR